MRPGLHRPGLDRYSGGMTPTEMRAILEELQLEDFWDVCPDVREAKASLDRGPT